MFGLISEALGGAGEKAQPMTLCKILQMLGTNPGKVRDLGIGEDFLARFYSDH